MTVYDELFPVTKETKLVSPTRLDNGSADGDALIRAVCALADEVRALREFKERDAEKADQEHEENIANTARMEELVRRNVEVAEQLNRGPQPPKFYAPAAPAPPVAQSERIQYPWCEVCQNYHHPDDMRCLKFRRAADGTMEKSE